MHTNWSRTTKQGLVAGMIGFLTVAVVIAVADMIVGRSPLYAAALLGGALFHGVTDPANVSVIPSYVLEYSTLHLAVYLAFGLVASALAAMADRGWQLWFVALFFLIFVSYHLVATVQAFALPMLSVLSAGAIWGAGLCASAAMAAYLLWRHPRIRTRQSW